MALFLWRTPTNTITQLLFFDVYFMVSLGLWVWEKIRKLYHFIIWHQKGSYYQCDLLILPWWPGCLSDSSTVTLFLLSYYVLWKRVILQSLPLPSGKVHFILKVKHLHTLLQSFLHGTFASPLPPWLIYFIQSFFFSYKYGIEEIDFILWCII